MKSAEQLNRIRQGAEDSFVPVHIAEVAMRLSAKAMEQKLQGIISDSMHLIEHTKEHMLESKKAIAQQIHDIDSQYKHEVKQNRLAMESKVAQTAQRDHLMAEYKMLQEQGRKRDDDINARISEFKGDMEKADALTGASGSTGATGMYDGSVSTGATGTGDEAATLASSGATGSARNEDITGPAWYKRERNESRGRSSRLGQRT